MHFRTLVVAGLSSLAAVAALPSHAHGVMPRHRLVRARKAEAAPSRVKRCAASSSAEVEATPVFAANAVEVTATESSEKAAPSAGTGGIAINDKLVALFPAGIKAGSSKWSTNPVSRAY